MPPPISSHEAATGFEGEFTETVIIASGSEDGTDLMAQMEDAPNTNRISVK